MKKACISKGTLHIAYNFYGFSFWSWNTGTLWTMRWQRDPFQQTVVWVAAHLNPGPPAHWQQSPRTQPARHRTNQTTEPGTKNYSDVIISAVASQITSVSIVYIAVCSGADQRKHQSSASLAFVRGIHRWPVNSPHKWPVTRKMFPFDDVIMTNKTTESWTKKIKSDGLLDGMETIWAPAIREKEGKWYSLLIINNVEIKELATQDIEHDDLSRYQLA